MHRPVWMSEIAGHAELCMQVIESIVARSMDCISLSVNCAKCLLRDPSVVARSIDWCANDRSIVRAEQSMDSANRSTARNIWRNGPYISGHLAFLFQIEF